MEITLPDGIFIDSIGGIIAPENGNEPDVRISVSVGLLDVYRYCNGMANIEGDAKLIAAVEGALRRSLEFIGRAKEMLAQMPERPQPPRRNWTLNRSGEPVRTGIDDAYDEMIKSRAVKGVSDS